MMEVKRLLIEKINDINPVTNVQGKGRNDFKIEVLQRCEELLHQKGQSAAVRKLADQVKGTLQLFRTLISKYGENIEVVDPMLRNNQELADVMGDLEKAWALAKSQIVDQDKYQQLLNLSISIEAAATKYKAFSEMIETCDSDIFIAIPGLAVLKTLTHAQEDESICRRFLPSMFQEGEEACKKYSELKSSYLKLKTRVCGGADFIIRSGSGGQKQRS